MSPPVLWIHKTADSDTFSRSSRSEERKIRHHVQLNRAIYPAANPVQVRDADVSPLGVGRPNHSLYSISCIATIESPLRPSKVLRRIPPSRTPFHSTKRLTRKQRNLKLSPVLQCSGWAVPRAPSWMWQSLCSAERHSLAFFELRTSRDWAGWQDASFWNVLALQVSQLSTAVAHSLVALAAMHESLETIGSSRRECLERLSAVQANRAAQELARAELSYFDALVSCLIMLCYQNFHGRRTSFLLLRSGMRILHQYLMAKFHQKKPKRLKCVFALFSTSSVSNFVGWEISRLRSCYRFNDDWLEVA